MRTKSTICILMIAIALAGIQQAQAGDKERYLIGGLLGGLILNEVVDGSSVEFRSRRPVRVEHHVHHRHAFRRPSGHYEYRRIKIWVPGCRERIVKRCGRIEFRWVPGHYEFRTQKVWVSYGRRPLRRHGRDRCSRY